MASLKSYLREFAKGSASRFAPANRNIVVANAKTYTAPADGYCSIQIIGQCDWVSFNRNQARVCSVTSKTAWAEQCITVRKGDVLSVNTPENKTDKGEALAQFRFFYAVKDA